MQLPSQFEPFAPPQHVMAPTSAIRETDTSCAQTSSTEGEHTSTVAPIQQVSLHDEETDLVASDSTLRSTQVEATEQVAQSLATPSETPEEESTLTTVPESIRKTCARTTEPAQADPTASHASSKGESAKESGLTASSSPAVVHIETEADPILGSCIQSESEVLRATSQESPELSKTDHVEASAQISVLSQAVQETRITTAKGDQTTGYQGTHLAAVHETQDTTDQETRATSIRETETAIVQETQSVNFEESENTTVKETQATTRECSDKEPVPAPIEPSQEIAEAPAPVHNPGSLIGALKQRDCLTHDKAESSNCKATIDKSMIVTLKLKDQFPQTSDNERVSPESKRGNDMAVTPARNEPATPRRAQRGGIDKENMKPLYGRDRNTRREATKMFREAPTPKKASTPKPSQARESETLAHSSKQSGASKRRPPQQEPAAKRRKETAARFSTMSNRVSPEPMDIDQPEHSTSERPERDEAFDEDFVRQMCKVLDVASCDTKPSTGRRQAWRILELLRLAEYPAEHEALFLTTEEATNEVAQGRFTKHIIVTTGQQTAPLQTVDEFLREFYDTTAAVWIQDPKAKQNKKATTARQVQVSQVIERFASEPTGKPWNLLELATHIDDGLRPAFLNNEDCRLLTKLKIPDPKAGPEARRRAYPAGFKEVEKWALVAQAGALTEPHQDSHGYSTFITVNAGLVGFGWLCDPSQKQREAWKRNPLYFKEGNWRYIVLKPGQTVYFPAGTVHFVFRLPSECNTLAFGGHVLRCSNIVHWVRTLIEERDQKDVTNEDLTETAPGYLAKVEKFVNQAKTNGTMDRWGGEESIEEFLRLKKEFLSRKQK